MDAHLFETWQSDELAAGDDYEAWLEAHENDTILCPPPETARDTIPCPPPVA